MRRLDIAVIYDARFLRPQVDVRRKLTYFGTIVFYRLADGAGPLTAFRYARLHLQINVRLLKGVLFLSDLSMRLPFGGVYYTEQAGSQLITFRDYRVVDFDFFWRLSSFFR